MSRLTKALKQRLCSLLPFHFSLKKVPGTTALPYSSSVILAIIFSLPIRGKYNHGGMKKEEGKNLSCNG
jgi:hypothetical protein